MILTLSTISYETKEHLRRHDSFEVYYFSLTFKRSDNKVICITNCFCVQIAVYFYVTPENDD